MKRKTVFLTLFIIGIILIFNITNYMLIEGFSDTLGIMQSSDKRVALSLISLFGLIGYFIEVIFERICKDEKIDNE